METADLFYVSESHKTKKILLGLQKFLGIKKNNYYYQYEFSKNNKMFSECVLIKFNC